MLKTQISVTRPQCVKYSKELCVYEYLPISHLTLFLCMQLYSVHSQLR